MSNWGKCKVCGGERIINSPSEKPHTAEKVLMPSSTDNHGRESGSSVNGAEDKSQEPRPDMLKKCKEETLTEVGKLLHKWFNFHRCIDGQYCTAKIECYNALLEEMAKLKEKAT